MVGLAYVAVAIAVVWVLVKLHMAYHSAGGTVMVTVYDAAVYPPILLAGGLYFLLPDYQVNLPYWAYLLIWAALTAAVVGAIRWMQEIGDKPL